MDDNDQDIDIAGTEADEGFWQRNRDRLVKLHDPTATPLGAVAEEPALTDPGTIRVAVEPDR